MIYVNWPNNIVNLFVNAGVDNPEPYSKNKVNFPFPVNEGGIATWIICKSRS
jgi:hypothetical protein